MRQGHTRANNVVTECAAMKRLYYLVDDLETTEQVSNALHTAGVTDWNFHAVSRDEAGLYQHHIHSAATYQQLDFIYTGERWAMAGAGIGLLVGIICEAVQPLPVHVDWLTVALFTLVCAGFGAWLGGMVGFSRENYKLAPFHEQIEAGKTLVFVDAPKAQIGTLQSLLRNRFPKVEYLGMDSPFINPFERPRVVYHQSTH
jgi:hypothetical protein